MGEKIQKPCTSSIISPEAECHVCKLIHTPRGISGAASYRSSPVKARMTGKGGR